MPREKVVGRDVGGRPSFVPTPEQREVVEELTGLMVPQQVVARAIGIDEKTLRKHFRIELDHGAENTVAKLKTVIYAKAKQGSLRAAQYLLDRMAVWPVPENVPAAATPLEIRVVGGLAAAVPPQPVPPKPNGHDVAAIENG